jgi:hypothetical protein
MADIREQILDRLVTVARVSGIATAVRNQGEISDDVLPAVIVFDADEQANDNDPRTRQANAPRRVAMMPEIRLLLGGVSEQVGTDLNTYRSRIIKAVLTDDTLLALTAENQSARYEGCATQFKAGRAMQADMLLTFRFDYYLKPSDL